MARYKQTTVISLRISLDLQEKMRLEPLNISDLIRQSIDIYFQLKEHQNSKNLSSKQFISRLIEENQELKRKIPKLQAIINELHESYTKKIEACEREVRLKQNFSTSILQSS